MSEMIDRMAIALMDTATSPHFKAVWADQPDDVKAHWRFAARAAIKVMRDLTDDMDMAGTESLPAPDGHSMPDDFRDAWRSAIDAALKA